MLRNPDAPASYSIGIRTEPNLYRRARLLAAVREVSLAELTRAALRRLVDEADDLPTLPRPD